MAAVTEHGYAELHLRGSFDPEVMSVVYLINAIGKENGVRASLVAWVLTFGRHLIPHAPREQVYLVHNGVELSLIHILCAAMPSASAPPEEKPQVLTFPPPYSVIIFR